MADVFAMQMRRAATVFDDEMHYDELRDDIADNADEAEDDEEDAGYVDFGDVSIDENEEDDTPDLNLDELPSDLKDFVASSESDDDDIDNEILAETPFSTFSSVQLFDSVLRGKRWTGVRFVDVERIETPADEFPYATLLLSATGGDAYDAHNMLRQFLDNHAARIEVAAAASPQFVQLRPLLTNTLSLMWLDVVDGYRNVLVTYNDCNTRDGSYRQALIECDATLAKSYVFATWFVLNVHTAARLHFFASVDALPDNVKRDDLSLYDLVVSVGSNDASKYAQLETEYAKAWSVIEA